MTNRTRALFEEAMQLDPEERAQLTGLLIDSLDPGCDEGVEEAWAREIERRLAEVEAGTARLVSWEELRARLYNDPVAPGAP